MHRQLLSGTRISPACILVLQLAGITGLGLKSFHQLHQCFGSVDAILRASFEELLATGIKPKLARAVDSLRSTPSTENQYHRRLEAWLAHDDQHILCLEDGAYPPSLLEIFCPPPLLYVKGDLTAFLLPSIAIVGSRHPTINGQHYAGRFARALAERNIVVTSGLAIGIDTCAHQGALAGNGVSCAVLGAGLDCLYPKQNQKLAMALAENGALVTEMALGVKALPANFPRRNRIISGLSKGVLVVEAGLKSGSLITADFALEQNRDVFAVPGPIDSALSKGCHSLIKQGAFLVEDVEDILQVLESQKHYVRLDEVKAKLASFTPGINLDLLNSDEQAVLKLIGHQLVSFDELMQSMSMDVSALTHTLMTLELKGILRAEAGGYQRL